jgi:hypothetical protein
MRLGARSFMPCRDHVDVGELAVLHVLLEHVPVGLRGSLGVGHDEGKLEHFRGGKAARRVARQRPDDVHRAVLRLVDQLWRRAAKLHRRISFDLDAAVGSRLDAVGPWMEQVGRHVGLRRQELVEPERHFLRACRQGGGEPAERGHEGGAQARGGENHVILLERRTGERRTGAESRRVLAYTPPARGERWLWRQGHATPCHRAANPSRIGSWSSVTFPKPSSTASPPAR